MRRSVPLGVLAGIVLVTGWFAPAAGDTGAQVGEPVGPEEKDPESEDRLLTAEEAELVGWLDEMGNDQVHEVSGLFPALKAQLGSAFGGAQWTSPSEFNVMVVGAEGSPAWNAATVWGRSLAAVDSDVLADVSVVVSSVKHSRAELDAIKTDARQIVDGLVGPGHFAAAAVNAETNAVRVDVVRDVLEVVAKELEQRYGDAVEVAPVDALGQAGSDRRDDNTPFYGAVALWQASQPNPYPPAGAFCTAGYTWRLWSSGQIVGSTMGHCGARGLVWWNATTPVGTVTHRAWGADDGEFITPPAGTSWDRRIWVGGRTTTVSWPVVGAVNEDEAWVGSQIVLSGSNNDEVRGTVTDVNAQVCYGSGVCVTGVTEFRITQGYLEGGSSGSPCFSSASGRPATVLARGMWTGPRDRGVGQWSYCESVFDISAALGGSIYSY